MRRSITIDFHGMRLRCHAECRQASAAIYFGGWPEFWEMHYVADALEPGDCFVDVGANIGLYTLLAARAVGPSGQVIAFEPGGRSSQRLEENVHRNRLSQVQIRREAVGETQGVVPFAIRGGDCSAHLLRQGEIEEECHTAAVVCLDHVLEARTPSLVKMDIEGFEPFALRGMRRMLANGIPQGLLIEVAGHSNFYGIPTSNILNDLAQLGYYPHRYEPDSQSCLPVQNPWDHNMANALFLRKE